MINEKNYSAKCRDAPPVRPGKQRCVFDCKWTRLDIEWERQKDKKTERNKDKKT